VLFDSNQVRIDANLMLDQFRRPSVGARNKGDLNVNGPKEIVANAFWEYLNLLAIDHSEGCVLCVRVDTPRARN
jgi:hypothetical protein